MHDYDRNQLEGEDTQDNDLGEGEGTPRLLTVTEEDLLNIYVPPFKDHSEDEGWLTVFEVRGHLRLSHNAALRWIRMHVPSEYRGKRGNHRLVHIKGLKAGLDKCVWRPKSPKGYQGHPGRKPPNVNCRDSRGRFVSHRPASEKRPKEGGWKSSRRNKYLISDAPIKSGVQDE